MKIDKVLFSLLVTAIILSCTRVELYEPPLKGRVRLTTDWSNRTPGIEQPESYKVEINNKTLSFTETSNYLPQLEAGTYPVYIYNTPPKININVTVANVNTTEAMVEALPGYLFTAVTDVRYADNNEENIAVIMRQQVRRLTIELTITEGDPDEIMSTTVTLSGIANSLNFKTDQHSGHELRVSPLFTRNKNILTATINLLGTTTESKILALDIQLTNGKKLRVDSDVSNLLADFNKNKNQPLKISANIQISTKLGLTIGIDAWKSELDSSTITI